jgi:outer membrane protein TolC
MPTVEFDNDVDRLIDFAKRLRPDLVASRAEVSAARSQVEAARAAGLPSVGVFMGRSMNDVSQSSPVFSNTLGVTITIPAFSGYATTYRIQAARDQLDARLASRDAIERQTSLDVWRAYQALTTDTQSLRATADLLASAEEAHKVALGRYQAGVGTLIELLNAQSALAGARAEATQATFNWHISRFSLGLAVGQLDFGMLDASQTRPQ